MYIKLLLLILIQKFIPAKADVVDMGKLYIFNDI